MTDVALISDLTWRSLDMQEAAFPKIAVFTAPDGIPLLFRPTLRKTYDCIHVVSLAVIADKEKDFRAFLDLAKKRGCRLSSLDENETFVIESRTNVEPIVAAWREARKRGAAKIGGIISAEKRRATSSTGAARIRTKWSMPSREHPTVDLLREASISYNTAISILGRRPIAQANYQAALKRKERRNAKAN
jgi:hypothetical protein